MRRMGILAMLVLLFGFGVALADDDSGMCSVEDWRYTHTPGLRMVTIEGTTTCKEGRISIRAYDTSDGSSKFMGVDDSHVNGFIFEAHITAIYEKPASMDIKYSIEVE